MYYNYQQGPQNGGLVRIKDENEAVNYPVAPGYSVILIDEGNTHLYVKTAGLSQFDRPTIESYKLTKETTAAKTEYATKADIEELKARIAELTKGETTDE
jgi:hypothetical protein